MNMGVAVVLGIIAGAVMFSVTSDPWWIGIGIVIGAALRQRRSG